MKSCLSAIIVVLFSTFTSQVVVGDDNKDIIWKIYHALDKGDSEAVKSLTREMSAEALSRVLVTKETYLHQAIKSTNYLPARADIPYPISDEKYNEAEASENKRLEIVEYLIGRGVDVNARGENGITPLMIAASVGNPVVADWLIAAGADIHARDDHGFTTLLHAGKGESLMMTRYFLEKGIDPTPVGSDMLSSWLLEEVLSIYRLFHHPDYINDEGWTIKMTRDLMIDIIEAFPDDYVINLDGPAEPFTYQKIFFRLEDGPRPEHVDPEIKDALEKIDVQYKKHGTWFYMMDGFVKKGEFEDLPLPDKAKANIKDWYEEKPGDKKFIRRPDGSIQVIM